MRGGIFTNDNVLRTALTEAGVGLMYASEPMVAAQLEDGRLQRRLEPYAANVPGFFLYYPSRAQSSQALRLFAKAAKELAIQPRRGSHGAS